MQLSLFPFKKYPIRSSNVYYYDDVVVYETVVVELVVVDVPVSYPLSVVVVPVSYPVSVLVSVSYPLSVVVVSTTEDVVVWKVSTAAVGGGLHGKCFEKATPAEQQCACPGLPRQEPLH